MFRWLVNESDSAQLNQYLNNPELFPEKITKNNEAKGKVYKTYET